MIRSEPNTKPQIAQDIKFCPQIPEAPTGSFWVVIPSFNSSCSEAAAESLVILLLTATNFSDSQSTDSGNFNDSQGKKKKNQQTTAPNPFPFSCGSSHKFLIVIWNQLESIFFYNIQEAR